MRVKNKTMSTAKFEAAAGVLFDTDPAFRRKVKREARKIIREFFEEVTEKTLARIN